jgi:ribonuclease D
MIVMSSSSTESLASVPESFIDTPEAWKSFVDEVIASGPLDVCSIDTEADSMHSYETKLCLIQFSIRDRLAIIDPLEIGLGNLVDFPAFIDHFDQVWMHGADYDISMFSMTFDWAPKTILDTQIAARLLGITRFGLANLLEEEYGVKLSKQSQKADWSRRPLSEKMLAYAFNDVRYLIDLGERFVERLKECGRDPWFIESCDCARKNAFERDSRPESESWRISGWGKLSPSGLNYLQHLWQWRDDECRHLDRPAFKFLGNKELFRMVQNLEAGKSAEPPHYLKPHYVRRMHKSIEKAETVDAKDFPAKRVRGNGIRLETDETRFRSIQKFRNQKAEELGIEGTVIATRLSMEKLASTNLTEEEQLDGLMNWQREILSPAISQ